MELPVDSEGGDGDQWLELVVGINAEVFKGNYANFRLEQGF